MLKACGHVDAAAHDTGTVTLEPVTVGWMAAAGHHHDEVVGAGGDRPRVEGQALPNHLARVDLDPGLASRATEVLDGDLRLLPQELADRLFGPAQAGHRPRDHSGD